MKYNCFVMLSLQIQFQFLTHAVFSVIGPYKGLSQASPSVQDAYTPQQSLSPDSHNKCDGDLSCWTQTSR